MLKGELHQNIELAPYTTWHIGGQAAKLYKPFHLEDLSLFLSQLPETEPLFWLGLGSNVLIREGGIAGTVVLTHNALKNMQRVGECQVRVEAGIPCPKVAKSCARLGLTGVEFLAGIPGTMGGALEMNAGAFGGEMWESVVSVEMIDRKGQRHIRTPKEFTVGYREVIRPANEWYVAAVLQLKKGKAEQSVSTIKKLLKKRGQTQPIGLFSAGSVFRNPPHHAAAKLIEECGLKGERRGSAFISEKHANFIINEGDAKASDIEWLMKKIMKTVKERFGIGLVPEVKIVGGSLC